MKILQSVTICLPKKDQDFEVKFIHFLGKFGTTDQNSVSFTSSDESYYPKSSFKFEGCEKPRAIFKGSEKIEIEIINKTGKEKKSPLAYTPIKLDDFLKRVKNLNFEFLDHIGFDLFWPCGAHPEQIKLRNLLSKESLYYRYPTGENWDFIIPGTQEEIKAKELDYKPIRRPKFEIVSLDYTSTPIIQFDMSVNENFEQIREIFPEGYPDKFLKNVWVYIENPYGLFISIVIGHRGKADWYRYLKKGLIG